ncbi:endonuclease subunit [uncultured Caudovirales phage]|uniref:Endonuclease subunit n=1 Tax=uncultured Caudovirales phage TaxID=2100421 RepID=A0A6J5LHT4_9CAUD|nr:endonuclease subunit [uncultured Caudovirales phage]
MLKIKSLSVKNFMSVGNATQAVNFDRRDLTLVLGQNLDLGGDDTGARNGTGKTTIINALSYALFGSALTNIKKDNLINKTNGKNMLVTVEFEKDGTEYKIERGRKPNTMAFYIGDEEQTVEDESQGDSRETQGEIDRTLGMSHDMFKHIVALNTYTEPFLALKANDQRTIIEQLLGITVLSEKADILKEEIKVTKDAIAQEEYRIKAVSDANARIEEQIASFKHRQTLWKNKKEEDTTKLLNQWNELQQIDIATELLNHDALEAHNILTKEIKETTKWKLACEQDQIKQQKLIEKLQAEIDSLEKHECYACGQAIHDSKHEEVMRSKQAALQEAALQFLSSDTQLNEHTEKLSNLGEAGIKPEVFYQKKEDAINHRNSVANLEQQLTAKADEIDPYEEQIQEMLTHAMEEINYDNMNGLISVRDHQEFLLKLLTNKDSFIRKRIIDQNLSYLNTRLSQYLERIGLPHTVKFNNDLTVSIEELGRELDFDNLSRGERNRLILSLSWAFRDVWESQNQQINLLFIDEVIDTGMDSSGVEASLAILKKMARDGDRSVWLVSHKDELSGRVNNVMKVIKENGFTMYNTEIEIA